MKRTVNEALKLLKRVIYHNFEWLNERGYMRRTAGILELDALSMINAQFNKLTRRLDKM